MKNNNYHCFDISAIPRSNRSKNGETNEMVKCAGKIYLKLSSKLGDRGVDAFYPKQRPKSGKVVAPNAFWAWHHVGWRKEVSK